MPSVIGTRISPEAPSPTASQVVAVGQATPKRTPVLGTRIGTPTVSADAAGASSAIEANAIALIRPLATDGP
jgi:hypothetical protein